jgi:hypothetical protein
VKPRLHVLLSGDGHSGVVLRRGPSAQVAAIAWNRDNDTFLLGQWLKGRIYERRSDLSPDGKHLIYFAMNGHWGSRAKGAWTAISIAPYLTAIALFAKGDCWHGGGWFVDKTTYWLNNGYGHEVLENTTRVTRATTPPSYATGYGGECPGVYFNRLQRDGWTMLPELTDSRRDVFDIPLSHGWVLRKIARAQSGPPPGKSVYFDEHELVHPATGRVLNRDTWEWASPDVGRVVWAEAGALWAGKITKASAGNDDPITSVKCLHDFSAMKFEGKVAPYAKQKDRAPAKKQRKIKR